ncbi:hypothetical protein PENTCL1PPCAC_9001, partial [Pristionchus entomophagus]
RILLALSVFVSLASSHCNECVLERERAEDWKIHGCRSCKSMQVEFEGNCPQRGYDCDEAVEMRTNVLGTDSCECSQLRCKDGNSSLAIGGELFTRVTCVDKEWSTLTKSVVESSICARKCGKGICRTHPDDYFNSNLLYVPFVVNPPDSEHSCAWGTCSYGAIASDSTGGHSYNSAVEFSCAGDRRWQDPNGNRHDLIACMQKECEPLVFDEPAIFCGEFNPAKHTCYEPKYVDGVSGEKTMTCDYSNALRYSSSDTIMALPICSNGQWTSNGDEIDDQTKVMCVTCPRLKTDDEYTEPTYQGKDKEATCPEGEDVFIEIIKNLGGGTKFVKLNTLRCNDQFVWEAIGGDFGDYKSLENVMKKMMEKELNVLTICCTIEKCIDSELR